MNRINALLLAGANNHDWRRSSPFCRDLLEGSGRFSVTLTEDPSAALEDTEALKGYRLIFSDYNGPAWSDAARVNLSETVRAGTGLVVLHAADNAFGGWVEYEKMVALLWREGSGHGAYHEFEVKIRDRDHPITRGLSDFRIRDELYHGLVHMHGAPYHVLAAAYSDPATGGSGENEPAATVQHYGEGRVFHCILGHVWRDGPMDTFENEDFQRLLLRGCEWAATGDVAGD